MASSSSVEYETLVQCTDKLCTGISQDPLAVSNKLYASGLVSEAQVRDSLLQSKDDYSKASVLVSSVTSKVKALPGQFGTVMRILNQFPWLQDVVKYVSEKYETTDLDTNHDDDIETITKANITKLEVAYASLVHDVAEKLEKLNVDFHSFRSLISIYIKEDNMALTRATTIADCLQALTSVTKWKSNSIIALEEICRKVGGAHKDIMTLISNYKSELAGFKATTKIVQFMRSKKEEMEVDELPANPPSIQQAMAEHDDKYCRTLSVKLKSRVTDKCLDYIDQLWTSLVEYLFLPTLPALLKSICKGCIEVNWLIPTAIAQEIKAQAQKIEGVAKMFDVIRVRLDDECLYEISQFLVPEVWEASLQGVKSYGAYGPRDVLILVSSESLQGEDIVPRKEGCLTKEDRDRLTNQGIPEHSWDSDASLMEARYKRERERYNEVQVLGREEVLTSARVKKEIRTLLKNTTKPGVTLHYIGPGRKNTGDWCFPDGFIEFRDIIEAYMELFQGKCLTIYSDCSYSGRWIAALRAFLDEVGVQPCGHIARNAKILLKVRTSCRSHQIPHTMLYSARGMINLNTGQLCNIQSRNYEIAEGQHCWTLDGTRIRCKEDASFEDPCLLPAGYKWHNQHEAERVYLVRGEDKGKPTWLYVLVADDEEMNELFHKTVASGNIDVADFGEVIKSGWGQDPPDSVREWIKKKYSTELICNEFCKRNNNRDHYNVYYY